LSFMLQFLFPNPSGTILQAQNGYRWRIKKMALSKKKGEAPSRKEGFDQKLPKNRIIGNPAYPVINMQIADEEGLNLHPL